jgi:hypothetical protein
MYLPGAQTVRLISIFDPATRLRRTTTDCVADVGKSQ